jgi:hypothetical protein
MKNRRKVFMRNTSALKVFLIAGGVLLSQAAVWADNPVESIQKAIVDKYQESSKPVFSPEVVDKQPKPVKADKFMNKMRNQRTKFMKKQHDRQREFIQNMQQSNLTPEEQQMKLADFYQKQNARQQKFLNKQHDKIDKHLAKQGDPTNG